MGTLFDDVVLQVVLFQKQKSFLIGQIGKFFQSQPVPAVPFRQIIFTEPVVGFPLTTAAEGLLVKGCPNLGIGTSGSCVIVATTFIPECRKILHHHGPVADHIVCQGIQFIREPPAHPAGNKPDQIGSRFHQFRRSGGPSPQGSTHFPAGGHLVAFYDPAVFQGEDRPLYFFLARKPEPRFFNCFGCGKIRNDRIGGHHPVDPSIHGQIRSFGTLAHLCSHLNSRSCCLWSLIYKYLILLGRFLSCSCLQLGIKNTLRFDKGMLQFVVPIAIALCPAGIGPVLRHWGCRQVDLCCPALPTE